MQYFPRLHLSFRERHLRQDTGRLRVREALIHMFMDTTCSQQRCTQRLSDQRMQVEQQDFGGKARVFFTCNLLLFRRERK